MQTIQQNQPSGGGFILSRQVAQQIDPQNKTYVRTPRNTGLVGQSIQPSLSVYDLPEEARPFTMTMSAKGQMTPKFNLNTRSGMAYALKAQGVDDQTIANQFGLQDPSQLGQFIQEDFANLKSKYEGEAGIPQPKTTAEWIALQKFKEEQAGGKVGKGAQLSSAAIGELSDAKTAEESLNSLESRIKGKEGELFGPTAGGLLQYSPFATKTQDIASTTKATAQILGKYLEGGKLAEGDIKRYREMLPQVSDTKDVALAKLNNVRDLLETRRREQVSALESSGYNVSGLAGAEPTVENQGLIKKAIQEKKSREEAKTMAADGTPRENLLEKAAGFLGVKNIGRKIGVGIARSMGLTPEQEARAQQLNPTAGQVVGDVGQLALMAGGGILAKGAQGAGMAARAAAGGEGLIAKALGTAAKGGVQAAEAAGYGLSGAMQNKESVGQGVAGGLVAYGLLKGGGKAVEKLIGSKTSKAIEALSPDLKGKKLVEAYKKLQGKSEGLLGKQTLSEDARTLKLADNLKDVIKSKNNIKNLTSIGESMKSTESILSNLLKTDNTPVMPNKVLFNLKQIKIPLEFKSEASLRNNFNNAIKLAVNLIKREKKPTINGLREARKKFDQMAQDQFSNAFSGGVVNTKTAAGRAIKEVRDSLNDYLYNTAANGSEIKNLIGKEADLYRALDIIAPKAAKEHGKNVVGRFLAKHPLIKYGATAGAGGAGYGLLTGGE